MGRKRHHDEVSENGSGSGDDSKHFNSRRDSHTSRHSQESRRESSSRDSRDHRSSKDTRDSRDSRHSKESKSSKHWQDDSKAVNQHKDEKQNHVSLEKIVSNGTVEHQDKKRKKEEPEVAYHEEPKDYKMEEDGNEEGEEKDEEPEGDPNALANFRISQEIRERLEARGIKSLFPIQSATFDYIYEGYDLIGRAKTGTGKTLAFALPVLERMIKSGTKPTGKTVVKVLVVAPTRELAKQISDEFQTITNLFRITCIYGGVAYEPQERDLNRGVDIVIGTPGRIIDHLERKNLSFDSLDYVILDEADRMLDMGFADDIEKILSQIPKSRPRQTLLFSATIPDWVSSVAKKYLKPDYKTVDLVGEERIKSGENLEHLAISCDKKTKYDTLADIVKIYGRDGRTIVFADTKAEATYIGTNSSIRDICGVIHGDIVQTQREVTLNGFRSGKFSCLVATDVAARGLDIPDVDLVIQIQPPKDPDSFIHRVGRTGRAGKAGTAIMFYSKFQANTVKMLEKQVGIEFKVIGSPQPEDLIRALAEKKISMLKKIPEEVLAKLPQFNQMAKNLIQELGAEKALALCLALLCDVTETPKSRSLLTSREGYITLQAKSPTPIFSPRYVANILEAWTKDVGQIILIEGGALVDVPEEVVDKILKDTESRRTNNRGRNIKNFLDFERCQKLPSEIEITDHNFRGRGDGGRGRGGFSGSYRGGRGGRDFSGSSHSFRRESDRGGRDFSGSYHGGRGGSFYR